ncbi:MAG: anti-sigma factor family protein [Anaerolineales bacterium]
MKHLTDELLNEYLDQALPADGRSQVEAHLAGCAECVARLDSLRSLFATLEALPTVPLARDLSAGVLARLPQPEPMLQPALNWVVIAQAVATAVLLAIAAPIFTTNVLPADLTSLSQPLLQIGADLLAGLQAQWLSLLSTLAQWSSWPLAGARSLTTPLAGTPAVLIGAITAMLVLLWIMGNGMLLRSTLTTRSR